jgi:hypothetical protein
MTQPPKPVLIPLSVAAKMLTLSERRVQIMCRNGEFANVFRPGGARGNYRLDKNEVQERVRKASER